MGKIVKIGIIGLGEIAQVWTLECFFRTDTDTREKVNHIQSLNNLTDHFQITYLCDVLQQALNHCAPRVNGGKPHLTTKAEELCASDEVDAVLICNSHAFHPAHTILALQHDKFVLCEKPLALNYRDIDAIIAAEKKSKGKVFVGYQRRYAESFLDAIKEVGGAGEIMYCRVRDIIGQNKFFVAQSGTYPKKFSDFQTADVDELNKLTDEVLEEAMRDYGIEISDWSKTMALQLGGCVSASHQTSSGQFL